MTDEVEARRDDESNEDSERDDQRWAKPCPIGLPQAPVTCLGFYERGPGRLQVRFPVRDNEALCNVILEENAQRVILRVLVCRRDDLPDRSTELGLQEERTHVELDAPLNGRPVIDLQTGRPMRLYVPTWLNGRRTLAPGYYEDQTAAAAGTKLLPRSEDQRPLHVVGALRRCRTCRF